MSYNSKYKGAEVEELLDSIGNKVDKVDGKQLSTEDFTTLLKQKLESLSNYDDTSIQETVSKLRTDLDTLVSGDTTTAIKTFNEVIVFLEGISDTEDLASIIASIEQQIADKYTKPSTGIPKTDLASDVQTSLGKADTALQSYTEQYKGTVTGVKINGIAKNPSSGIVDLGTVITEHQTLKTINGQSIVGSGDITINSGSSGGSGGAYPEVNHGTADTTLTITPNTFHVWDEVASLTLDFGSETSGVANEFLFQFTSGSTATSLTLPDDIKWANDSAPTIEANMIYQVSILKGLASVLEFSNPNTSVFYIDGIEFEVEEGMTWEEWLESDYNTANYYYDSTGNLIIRNVNEFEYYALPEVVISDIIIINNDYMETPY